MNKSYSELIRFSDFESRYKYLKLSGIPGDLTFGNNRYLNQRFYTSQEWKKVRRDVIARDEGRDLAIFDREIHGKIIVHHINPVRLEDVESGSYLLFDLDNLICVSHNTHEAIHYGDESILFLGFEDRKPGDTKLW